MAPRPPQLVFAASSADAGVVAWDLRTGSEAIRHRPCASRPRRRCLPLPRRRPGPRRQLRPHSLLLLGQAPGGVKSFPAEPIRTFIADPEGSYLIGGGVSGDIFFWEARELWFLVAVVASGELLVQWHAHYRAVRCLALYDLLLVSGSEDGSIKVWDLLTTLDVRSRLEAKAPYLYSFNRQFSMHCL